MVIVLSCVAKLEKTATTMTQTNKQTKHRNTSHGQKSISNRTIYHSFMLCVCQHAHIHNCPMINQPTKNHQESGVCKFACGVKKNCQMHFQLNLHAAKKEENRLSFNSNRKIDGKKSTERVLGMRNAEYNLH